MTSLANVLWLPDMSAQNMIPSYDIIDGTRLCRINKRRDKRL